MNRLIISCLLLLISCSLWAQSPKREQRSVWLATVYNLDWPKNKINTTGNISEINSQKKRMITILDSLVSANMNAVAFQVRSRCDAMYQSSYEPWSSDLVATRGMEPGYDPLAFVIEEGHKRGLEVHAWINPYRYESLKNQWDGLPGAYRETHPEWLIDVGNASILNPGIPEVQEHVTNIIKEIVTDYDIDGVMFDDYFYLQGIGEQQDREQYEKYNPDKLSLGDWRREQVNTLVRKVYHMIQSEKSYCRFGIGPAGIWGGSKEAQEKYGFTNPPGISGGFAFNGIFCDPLAWLTEGTIDYITPQIYWTTDSGTTDYNVLAPWWANVAGRLGKHFYSSQTLSDMTASVLRSVNIEGETIPAEGLSSIERSIYLDMVSPQTRAFGFSEIDKQIQKNRSSDRSQAPGSVFYSASKLYLTNGFVQYLKENIFNHKALVPAVSWKEHPDYGMVENLSFNNGLLSWNPVGDNVKYSIYAVNKESQWSELTFSTSEALLGVCYTNSFQVPENLDPEEVIFGVAVFDRYGNEFPIRLLEQNEHIGESVSLVYPADGETVKYPFDFKWEGYENNYFNLIEVASDKDFKQMMIAQELTSGSFPTENMQDLEDGRTYFWRVISRRVNAVDVYSPVRQFKVDKFVVTYPQNNSSEVSVSPTIEWKDFGSQSYTLEIAKAVNFATNTIVFSEELTTNSFTIPDYTLQISTEYYVRVKTSVNEREIISDFVKFTTADVSIPAPVITSPAQDETIVGSQIHVKWQGSNLAVDGYRVELSTSPTFGRYAKIQNTQAGVFETSYEVTTSGTYYLRARAIQLGAAENWSEVVRCEVSYSSGLYDISKENEQISLSRVNSNYKLTIHLEDMTFLSAGLYQINGNKIRDLYRGIVSSGKKDIEINTSQLSGGVYIVRLLLDEKQYSLKLIVE